MPSFDIVPQVNLMEIENAVNQAKKELANRFDFKGGKWEIGLKKPGSNRPPTTSSSAGQCEADQLTEPGLDGKI